MPGTEALAKVREYRAGVSSVRPDVSIVILNYNSGAYLAQCLDALGKGLTGLAVEILVLDNRSTDGSFQAARARHQEVGGRWPFELTFLEHPANFGFARGSNVGLRLGKGRYLLLLNPDCIVRPKAIRTLVEFMDAHPKVGICGPKVLLPDGRLDAPCRRSVKTPALYFYKVLGLSRLFSHSRRFGQYYLTYLDEDKVADVGAVIGGCLVIRREAMEEIGLLDERFFMYCEDEDWCFRAKQAGWRVVYNPGATVVHYKGASARKRPLRMTFEWHKAIWQFHRKNLAGRYPGIINLVVYAGIGVSLAGSLLLNLPRPRMRWGKR